MRTGEQFQITKIDKQIKNYYWFLKNFKMQFSQVQDVHKISGCFKWTDKDYDVLYVYFVDTGQTFHVRM